MQKRHINNSNLKPVCVCVCVTCWPITSLNRTFNAIFWRGSSTTPKPFCLFVLRKTFFPGAKEFLFLEKNFDIFFCNTWVNHQQRFWNQKKQISGFKKILDLKIFRYRKTPKNRLCKKDFIIFLFLKKRFVCFWLKFVQTN